jgi:hypothetical protein
MLQRFKDTIFQKKKKKKTQVGQARASQPTGKEAE